MTSPPDPADTLRRMPPTPWETEIVQVAPGTRIERDGAILTVTDESAVVRGHRIYVTPRHYDAIKMRVSDV